VLELSTPVKFVKRVGERIAAGLATRGVDTVEDLLYHIPFRYEDRLNPQPMAELVAGSMASVIGEVRGSVLLRTRSGPIFEMTLGQGLGTVKCMWFHGTYLKDRFKLGQMVAVYGKLEPSRSAMAAAAAGIRDHPRRSRSRRLARDGPHRPRLRVARRIRSLGQEAHLQVDAPRRLERLRAAKQRVR
jgi:RecG-like helicase